MLISRNVTIGSLRTSMRLEPEFWAALAEIAEVEGLSLDELCTRVDACCGTLSRSGAVRMFTAAYFRSGAGDADGTVAGDTDARKRDLTPMSFSRLQA